MELILGLVMFVIVGVALYIAVKHKGALELFNDAPYKTEAPKIDSEKDDINVYPHLKAIAPAKPIIGSEKGKMAKPKLVKVEGGPDKPKAKPVATKAKPVATKAKPVATKATPAPTKAKPNVAQGKPQGTKNKTPAPKPNTTNTNPPTNKKRKPKN